MAKVKIQGHASGTGIFTVTAPNSNTDRTITLPDGTGTLALTTGDDDKLPLAGGTLTGNLDVTMTSVGDGIDLIDTHTAHGITDYLPTNASLRLTEQNDTEGGGRIVGATDNTGQHGLSLYGLCQDSAVATVNNIMFVGAERSGTGIAAVANDKSVFKFLNNASTLLDIKGDGRGRSEFTIGAWINFNGQGTVAIRDSHNVSSLSDAATGDYIVYFDIDFSSVNHVMASDTGMGVSVNATTFRMSASGMAAGQGRIAVRNTTNQAWVDEDYVTGMWVGPV